LIDARLLTSFELRGEDGGPTRRVEVVHESLLRAWPRLVRWQAQDAEGALLRDQLRQAAHLWEEKGRPDDLLWTGTSYREYAVWRERYPGALSSLEEAFAAAMTVLANRRRRRRRIALAASFAVLLAVLAVVGTLWRRSVQETRRAEAAKLLALAQARLVDDPTEALALPTASLEVADTPEAREFVMRALWTAPPASELVVESTDQRRIATYSPDGLRVAVAGYAPEVRVWSDDGQGPIRLGGHSVKPPNVAFWAAENLVVTGKESETDARRRAIGDRVQLWSIPEGTLLRAVEFGSPGFWTVGPGRLFVQIELGEGPSRRIELRSWKLPNGAQELLDSLTARDLARISDLIAAPDGSGWVVARGREVSLRTYGGDTPERLLDELETDAVLAPFGQSGILAFDETGSARLWSFGDGGFRREWAIRRPAGATSALPNSAGRRLAGLGLTDQSLRVWELGGLPGAKALELRRSGRWYDPGFAFHPNGDWGIATTHNAQRLTLWPLRRPFPSIIESYDFSRFRKPLVFSSDGQWLATGWEEGVRLLPVKGGDPSGVRQLSPPGGLAAGDICVDPQGRFILVCSDARTYVVPLDGGPWREVIPGDAERRQVERGAISPSGARVANAYFLGEGPFTLSVVDLASGVTTTFDLPVPEGHRSGYPGGVNSLDFLDEQTILTMGWGGLRRWDLATGTHELLAENDGRRWMDLSRTTGMVVAWAIRADIAPSLELIELATGASRTLDGFGSDVAWADLDPSGTVLATGCADGTVRVGPLDGGEPHLLPGHIGNVTNVAVSPDLRWVASAGEDGTLRLWPMPDLSKPPPHTLPHDELLAKLHSLTNLRAVRDPSSDTGWTIEIGPFPGWREVPTW
jgi:hypothetical protein